MELISVIVPVYNMELYLRRCMETLVSQTQDNYEILLVDDGSTDESPKICDEYEKEYADIVRVIHKKNGGLSSARNEGIRLAKGRYIIFPDPDDWVEPDYLKTFVELKRTYKTDLVCTGYFVDYDHKCVPVEINGTFEILKGRKAQEALLLTPGINGFAWNKLYDMEIIRENNLFFANDVGTTEDLDFTFRYLSYCESMCFAPQIQTYHYYQRNGAATHSGFSAKKLESIRTYEKMIDATGKETRLGIEAKGEICNTAMNLLPLYFISNNKDEKVFEIINSYVKKYFGDYLKSEKYGMGRKVQAVLARCAPKIYGKLKNIISEGEQK